MFSGLIEQIGTITRTNKQTLEIHLRGRKPRLGDSLAINGTCLTVAKRAIKKGALNLTFELSEETLKKTTLKYLHVGQKVHVEQALSTQAVLGGHIVQGHVDGVGRIQKVKTNGKMKTIWVKAPKAIMTYVVEKGSVAVDGVSLTAIDVKKDTFSVALIPHTLSHTNFGKLRGGEAVNLEADIIAKYIHKYIKKK